MTYTVRTLSNSYFAKQEKATASTVKTIVTGFSSSTVSSLRMICQSSFYAQEGNIRDTKHYLDIQASERHRPLHQRGGGLHPGARHQPVREDCLLGIMLENIPN